MVKTSQFGYDIVCETNYQKGQVIFQIIWTNKDGIERIVRSTKSATDAAKVQTTVSGISSFWICLDFLENQ